jgi:hypothetical protein
MTDAPAPTFRAGWLWAVLVFLLVVGTVASAFVVYGLQGLLEGVLLPYLPIAIVGAFVTLLAILFIAGFFYRIDRLRGVPHKEVRLFE